MSNVDAALGRALARMKNGGFAIRGEVEVMVDQGLHFMGYTYKTEAAFKIVVSGMAVESGLVEGLLIHELSHIYRMEQGHPSHNGEILGDVLEGVVERFRVRENYQTRILSTLLNHLQDIYADDVSFKVFMADSGPFDERSIQEFMVNWVKPEGVETLDGVEGRWVNAAILVSNAFAVASLERRGLLEGVKGEMAARNQPFLRRVGEPLAGSFESLLEVLTNLREDLDQTEFRDLAANFLSDFVRLVRG